MDKKVLTIDDSKTLRMIVEKYLSPFGVQMLQAENGEQGIECARKGSPDLILLDYNMPVMDGIETGQHVSTIRWNVNQMVEAVETEWPHIAETFPIRECAITAAEDTIRTIEAAIAKAVK